MAQSLSQIKALLSTFGLRPKHRLGQNFLHDGNKMAAIVDAADIVDGDVVLEVGAGTGGLSQRLLDAGAVLIAVEVDSDLEPILQQQLASHGDRATLLIADVLSSKHRLNPVVDAAVDAAVGADGQFKLIANLPYNVASPLIANLVTDYPRMRLAIVAMQREVADRLTAAPGSKAYGPLGILVQAICHIEHVTALPPGCFWPQPKVDSMAIRLLRRDKPLTDDPHALADMLQRLFSKRRKQLGAILGRDTRWPDRVDPSQRPEQLTIEQLVALCDLTETGRKGDMELPGRRD